MMKNKTQQNMADIKGKKILVVGMGRSGKASVRELKALGALVYAQDISPVDKIDPKFVTYLEREGIKSFFGGVPDDMSIFDMIVMSPGVPTDLPFLNEARSAGVEMIGELELAYRLSNCKYVAITGTNGKTTTTALTGAIFEKSGRKTAIAGNIGVAVISKALEAEPDEWMITEVSSFQLESTVDFKPEISAILNLSPDHLNRHKTMEAYAAAKAAVFANQTEDDYLVINKDDQRCFALAKK